MSLMIYFFNNAFRWHFPFYCYNYILYRQTDRELHTFFKLKSFFQNSIIKYKMNITYQIMTLFETSMTGGLIISTKKLRRIPASLILFYILMAAVTG